MYCVSDRFPHSLNGLNGVAWALVSEKSYLVFTSSRGKILHTAGFSGMNSEFLGVWAAMPPTHPKIRLISRSIRENQNLSVAVGNPGLIDVLDAATLICLEIVSTEKGALTLAFDAARNKLYAFLLQTHRAQVIADA